MLATVLAAIAGPSSATSRRGDPTAPAARCGDLPAPRIDARTDPRIERAVGAMGTTLSVEVEGFSRADAVAASEAAVRAIEAAEERLSTWRATSELSRLNASAIGETVEISEELAAEIGAALAWSRATGGAFDPAVGGLVRAWGLRTGGRQPERAEIDAALVRGGAAAGLALEGRRARRLDRALALEEGGFGKGAGLDAALHALARSSARAATLDLGGQVALFDRDALAARARRFEIADPRSRARAAVAVTIEEGSLSTSGNSEKAVNVGGVRVGHILDPRTGAPARDFGSLTVWTRARCGGAPATAADCLSTGLFVLGPERALAFAREHPGVEVLAIEVRGETLLARASAGWIGRVAAVDTRVELTFEPSEPESTRTR